jgi:hypothetical protein
MMLLGFAGIGFAAFRRMSMTGRKRRGIGLPSVFDRYPIEVAIDRWPSLFLASRPNPAGRDFGNNNDTAIETFRAE